MTATMTATVIYRVRVQRRIADPFCPQHPAEDYRTVIAAAGLMSEPCSCGHETVATFHLTGLDDDAAAQLAAEATSRLPYQWDRFELVRLETITTERVVTAGTRASAMIDADPAHPLNRHARIGGGYLPDGSPDEHVSRDPHDMDGRL